MLFFGFFFSPVSATPCAPAERRQLPGGNRPLRLPFLRPNCSKKRCRSLPVSRTAAAPEAKRLGWCSRAWRGLLGVGAGNATGALMAKNGFFYISAESLLLLHLSAEEGCEQERTGAGSRA